MRDHDPLIIDQAVALAAQWQNRANELLTRAERDYQRRLQRLMANPKTRCSSVA